MEATEEQKKAFCEQCGKEKDADKCIEVDGKKVCCSDCRTEASDKPAICEFC